MWLHHSELTLSATDLSNFLGCRHRTALDYAAALGVRKKPARKSDPLLDVLIQRGLDHEARYVDTLRAEGLRVTDLSHIDSLRQPVELAAATLDAMRSGADAIVQGALIDGAWFGKPDVLHRTPAASALGDWSYEVTDTKLARETRAGTILQLGLYSEMLAGVQQSRPEYFHVVTPDPVHPQHTYRLDDYAAYFRLIRSHMLAALELDPDELASIHYPEPVEHCEICKWVQQCVTKRLRDDHLSLVANITRLQRRELEAEPYAVRTLTQLAGFSLDGFKPRRGRVDSYVRAREQARLQLESRAHPVPLFQLRAIAESGDQGLCRLPEPSPGDIFLDLEGDPLAAEGGREYLFGIVTVGADGPPEYRSFWGLTAPEERGAFEQVLDLIMDAWKRHPEMHVYHYAPYEPSAFKRLMGRYATRENEMDTLLRKGKFVDLFGVVRQGLLVGTERYSIKNLEPVYGFKRTADLRDANRCLRLMEQALQLSSPETLPREVRDTVESYNRDDCVSTLRLRDWLEQVRAEAIAVGTSIPRPRPPEEEAREPTERQRKIGELRLRLLSGVPEEQAKRSDEQQARWLLAYMLDYHSREDKAVWWEYFRLRELPEEDLFDEPQAIAGLKFQERVHANKTKTGKLTGVVVDRYWYPAQEMEIERGQLHTRTGTFGVLVAVDREAQTIEVRKRKDQIDTHPSSVFEHTYINTEVFEQSLCGIGERVVASGDVAAGRRAPDRVGRSLLLALPPRLGSAPFGMKPGEDPAEFLSRTVLDLDHTVLSVQGPPGAGKTYCGAEMICALVREKKRVGVAAISHKVIRLLLDAAHEAARKQGLAMKLLHKTDDDDHSGSAVASTDDNETALAAIQTGEVQVLGGTGWMWSRPDFANSVDVLFVDEAGQMSLANVLAASPAAKSIVLLGDPQQLEQPRKGSHPDGVGISALQHMLRGQLTMEPGQGVFLPTTWRMCPAITRFTSELFYENRLEARAGLEKQTLHGADVAGAGLWVVHAEHDGNRTWSSEEIALVERLIHELTATGSRWIDQNGKRHEIRGSDILVVAPYNAQVSRLKERLAPLGARVGTVDKFQGQEAPVVIYSMVTSRPEDAPRGMEFLYSLNRLNVATSRARCAAILVASEMLFEPDCRTPRQMKLANALCRYRELATTVEMGEPKSA